MLEEEEDAQDYASATASGLQSPVGLSRGFKETPMKANPGTLDNASSKKRYGHRTFFTKYTISNYETPLQEGGQRPMPCFREFYDILDRAELGTDTIVTCHELFSNQEIHVEFKDEFFKTLGESKWLDKTLAVRGSKATKLPRRFNDNRIQSIVVASRACPQGSKPSTSRRRCNMQLQLVSTS